MNKFEDGYKKVKWLFGRYEKIPEKWSIKKINDLATVHGRIGWKNLRAGEYVDSGPLMLSVWSLIENIPYGIDYNVGSKRLSKFRYDESPEIQLKDEDVLIAKDGDIGRTGFVKKLPERSTVNSHVVVVRIKNKQIHAEYLYHYMRFHPFQAYCKSHTSGTTVHLLTQKDLRNALIISPSMDEQQKIASILSGVDALIESTQQTIETTERLKKGLMQQLLTEGIEHKKYKPLMLNKYSAIRAGHYPIDWVFLPLGDPKSGFFSNGVNKTKEDYGHGCLFVNILDVFREFTIDPKKLKRVAVTEEEIKRYRLMKNDLILDRSSNIFKTVGFPSYFAGSNEPVVFSGFTFRYRPNSKTWDSLFLTYQLMSFPIRKLVISIATKSANSNVNQNSYKKIQIPTPTLPEQTKIASILSGVDAYIQKNQQYKEKLKKLKKSLMQKLLTGQIRVKV